MGAIFLRARSELRHRMRSTVALAVIIGLAFGLVLASAAGAHRTDTAFLRLLSTTGAPDAVGVSNPVTNGLPPSGFAAAVRRLPEVARVEVCQQLVGEVVGHGRSPIRLEAGVFASVSRHPWYLRGKLVAGRWPDQSRQDEVMVNPGSLGPDGHRGPGVGARVTVRFLWATAGARPGRGPYTAPFAFRVVGLWRPALGGWGQYPFPNLTLTRAFFLSHRDEVASLPGVGVWYRPGAQDQAFLRDASRAEPHAYFLTVPTAIGPLGRPIHLQAVALWLFAALAAASLVVIFGQTLSRVAFLEATEHPALSALGMTRPQLFGVAMIRAGAVATVAAVVALAVAFGLSSLAPIGSARAAEPNPGLLFDPFVLGIGVPAVALLVVLSAAWPSWRAAGLRGDALGTVEGRPSAVAGFVVRAGLPPTATAGVRMALEPGRGRTSVPVRSALVGAIVALVAVSSAFTFGVSMRHLLATPRLYGWNWDFGAGDPYSTRDLSNAGPTLLGSVPGIEAYAGANILTSVRMRGPSGRSLVVPAVGIQQIRGVITPTMIRGRWPQSPDEVALGTKSLRQLGTAVGGTIRATGPAGDRTLRVVGQAVFPEVTQNSLLGNGSGFTLEGLRMLAPGVPENVFLIRKEPGVDPKALFGRLQTAFRAHGGVVGASQNADIQQYHGVVNVPLALAAVLALVGAASLAHLLVTSTRRRGRDLAVLKTLGFVGRQVSATVAWQATALVVVALALGLPIGIAAGRWAWNFFADRLGVFPLPVVPLLPILIAIPVTVLLANLVAALPGRIAARISPAIVLRTE